MQSDYYQVTDGALIATSNNTYTVTSLVQPLELSVTTTYTVNPTDISLRINMSDVSSNQEPRSILLFYALPFDATNYTWPNDLTALDTTVIQTSQTELLTSQVYGTTGNNGGKVSIYPFAPIFNTNATGIGKVDSLDYCGHLGVSCNNFFLCGSL